MANKGYIKLYRQIQDCWLWDDPEPFDKRAAWIDLLMLANHSDNKMLYEGEIIVVQKGQLVTSILKLSERWKWSRKKTTRFLKLLENDGMVTLKVTTKGTTVSIVNWGKYQLDGTTEDTTEEQQRVQLRNNKGTTEVTTEEQQRVQPRNINNNDNNVNNEKNDKNDKNVNNDKKKKAAFIPPTVEEVAEYCRERNNNIDAEAFVAFYQSKGWMIGKDKMKDWKSAVITWEKRSKKDSGGKVEYESAYMNAIKNRVSVVDEWVKGGKG